MIYYPLYHWVHEHLAQGRLPLISDLAYHGAPVAAVSMVGVLSPFLWLFHAFSSFTAVFNFLFLFPTVLYLSGSYFLGRRLGLSQTASLLLAFLWTYNGHQMAQLDHLNVAWAHAFFPWAFLSLLNYLESRKFFWILLSSSCLALNLLSGHPQVVFLESLFFLFWALLWDSYGLRERLKAFTWLGIGAFLFASPLILFTLECHWPDGLGVHWSNVDRYFHSWTPLNFITLLFPWFFGHDQYDRAQGDYWWQYQFVEMQVAFSIVGLFFVLLFFLRKRPQRRFIGITSLFAVLMAFGKFFFLFPFIQSLPIFSFFRDPARYWFLATWVLGLGAAYAWEEWFENNKAEQVGRKHGLSLGAVAIGILALGWLFLNPCRNLTEKSATWAIQHLLMGDGIHKLPLSAYLGRLPEKMDALASNLNPFQSRIFLPLLFLVGLLICIFNRKKWDLKWQKGVLLFLVFADLMVFRMPLGNAFYNPTKIPQPAYPAPQNRSLVLLSQNTSPLPNQYGEMAYPNMNFVSERPNLIIDANPGLARYNKLAADLGWFSWVYKDRDPEGFAKRSNLLGLLGVDQIVSDKPFSLSTDFQTIQNTYPYVYHLKEVMPKAYLEHTLVKTSLFNSREPHPQFNNWDETRLSFLNIESKPTGIDPDNLYLQKTFLPGWKATVNGKPRIIEPGCETLGLKVLMTICLDPGKNRVELTFEPTGLRLGFFLFFLLSGVLAFFLIRIRFA